MVDYVIAVIPSIGVGLLFYFVIRAIVNADRNERKAIARLEEAENLKASDGSSPSQ